MVSPLMRSLAVYYQTNHQLMKLSISFPTSNIDFHLPARFVQCCQVSHDANSNRIKLDKVTKMDVLIDGLTFMRESLWFAITQRLNWRVEEDIPSIPRIAFDVNRIIYEKFANRCENNENKIHAKIIILINDSAFRFRAINKISFPLFRK